MEYSVYHNGLWFKSEAPISAWNGEEQKPLAMTVGMPFRFVNLGDRIKTSGSNGSNDGEPVDTRGYRDSIPARVHDGVVKELTQQLAEQQSVNHRAGEINKELQQRVSTLSARENTWIDRCGRAESFMAKHGFKKLYRTDSDSDFIWVAPDPDDTILTGAAFKVASVTLKYQDGSERLLLIA